VAARKHHGRESGLLGKKAAQTLTKRHISQAQRGETWKREVQHLIIERYVFGRQAKQRVIIVCNLLELSVKARTLSPSHGG
jgi:hypothetical protein